MCRWSSKTPGPATGEADSEDAIGRIYRKNHTITPVFKKGKLRYAELVYAFVKSL